jgi:hypothetical protein
MKHIKTFENKEGNKYWLIPTDARFSDSLVQIGCDEKRKFLRNTDIEINSYVFIGYNKKASRTDNVWGWNPYKGFLLDEFYERENYEFQGTVNINGGDPKFDKDANKYNL